MTLKTHSSYTISTMVSTFFFLHFFHKFLSVINITLPDEKSNYVHRIGRVGRAERMGLAISLVATIPEKVWYHTCNGGRNCYNTNLTDNKGCCTWYNEMTVSFF